MLPCKPSPDSEAFQFVGESLQMSSCYLWRHMICIECELNLSNSIVCKHSPLKNNLFNLVHLQIWLCHRKYKEYDEIIRMIYRSPEHYVAMETIITQYELCGQGVNKKWIILFISHCTGNQRSHWNIIATAG